MTQNNRFSQARRAGVHSIGTRDWIGRDALAGGRSVSTGLRPQNGSTLVRYSVAVFFAAFAIVLGMGSAAYAAGDSSKHFEIKSKPLAQALMDFGTQSGLTVVAPTSLTQGKRSAPVRGDMSPDLALERLLAKTGLEFARGENGSVTVQSASSTATVQPSGGQSSSGKNSARTLAIEGIIVGGSQEPLVGALVKVVETGESTATDGQGRFRFASLASGTYTLSMSFLGYTDKEWRVAALEPNNAQPSSERTIYDLVPSAWDIGEVTVFGVRSSRSIALNEQRSADNNSEVVSADTLGNFTGTTISESLRRVAGVSFTQNANGDGANIMIRGLEPDMNAVKMNGLNLPVGDGLTRSADLSNLLTDSISKITISKTLLPSQDSSGTGGLVEIETKSPLEREARYANFSAEGGRRGGDFGNDSLLSGTLSGIFGDTHNFGVSVSGQYKRATHDNIGFNNALDFGQYLPLSPGGTPTFQRSDLDPRLTFPYGPADSGVYAVSSSVSSSQSHDSIKAVTLSSAWQPSDNSGLRLDMQRSESTVSTYNATGSLNLYSYYIPRPVAALGGAVRNALTYQDGVADNQTYDLTDDATNLTETVSLKGHWDPGKWHLNSTVGYAYGATRTPDDQSLSLGFQSTPQEQFYGESLTAANFLPSAVDPGEHLIITPFAKAGGPNVVLPLFTPATWKFFNNANDYYLGYGEVLSSHGSNDRETLALDGRYDLKWRAVKYIQAGFNFERAEFESHQDFSQINPNVSYVNDPNSPTGTDAVYPSLAPLGLTFVPTNLSRIGYGGQGFNYLSESGVRGFFDHLNGYVNDPKHPVIESIQDFPETALESRKKTVENNLATFVQAELDFGRLQIIGGVRVSRVEVRAVTPTGPHIYGQLGGENLAFAAEYAKLLDQSVTETNVLPRVNLNFRQSDRLIWRGGYFQTTARPALTQLSTEQSIYLYEEKNSGPNNNQEMLSIGEGNPGLKPSITNNFDFDVEYYDGSIGLIRLGTFYKRITDALQNNQIGNFKDLSGVQLPNYPDFNNLNLNEVFVEATKPENSKTAAEVWGVELHVERQFTFLPGWWSGLGMYSNFGYTDSDATRMYQWEAPTAVDAAGYPINYELRTLIVPHQRFDYQVKTTGTLALTYNKRGVDATLGYSFQDRYQTLFSPNNLAGFAEPVRTLDFRGSYLFDFRGMKCRAFFDGTNLLKGIRDPDLLQSYGSTSAHYINAGTYLGGRELRIGVQATF